MIKILSRLKFFFAVIIFLAVSAYAQTAPARETVIDLYASLNVSPNEITALVHSGNYIV